MSSIRNNLHNFLIPTVLAACFCGQVLAVDTASAVEVDPPMRIVIATSDGERLRGWLEGYDDEGFDFKTFEEEIKRVAWSELPPAQVMRVHDKVLHRSDARGWFTLAAMLHPREEGKPFAEKALVRAVHAEPELEDKAERLRNGEAVAYDDPEPTAHAGDEGGAGHEHGGEGEGGAAGEGGPVSIGDIQSQFWGELSDELMQSSVEELKSRMLEAQKNMNHRLAVYEEASDYFLFYSDLPAREARQWAGLLDEMYDKLTDIFDIKRGTNIYRGRGLIVVFANEEDYHRYQVVVHGYTGSRNTAGLCRSFGDGHVEVTFYKQRNQLNFARVLVHEAVHSFLHRYRSYPRIVSWINEGLAEYVSAALVEGRGYGESDFAQRLANGERDLRALRSLGGNSFFYGSHIQGWQYPVAQMLTGFMIRQDGKRYRAFITAIKDGKPWDQAIVEDYGVSVERLVDAFGQTLRIRDLQP